MILVGHSKNCHFMVTVFLKVSFLCICTYYIFLFFINNIFLCADDCIKIFFRMYFITGIFNILSLLCPQYTHTSNLGILKNVFSLFNYKKACFPKLIRPPFPTKDFCLHKKKKMEGKTPQI